MSLGFRADISKNIFFKYLSALILLASLFSSSSALHASDFEEECLDVFNSALAFGSSEDDALRSLPYVCFQYFFGRPNVGALPFCSNPDGGITRATVSASVSIIDFFFADLNDPPRGTASDIADDLDEFLDSDISYTRNPIGLTLNTFIRASNTSIGMQMTLIIAGNSNISLYENTMDFYSRRPFNSELAEHACRPPV